MTKTLLIDAQSILNLLIHYSDGKAIPMDGELKSAGVSQFLQRWIGLVVESDKWEGPEVFDNAGRLLGLAPVHVRYEGNHVLVWDTKGQPYEWKEGPG